MHGNNPIRVQEKGDGLNLWVQEVFYTLQGEGPFVGRPSVFVRLGGCNLACYFCDTDFESSTWKPDIDELLMRIKDELKSAPQADCKLVVLTGGEPLRQNIVPLVTALVSMGMTVQLETNGTLYQDLPWSEQIHIVCSPKTSGLNTMLVPYIDAYKYVLKAGEIDEEDGLPSGSTKQAGRPDHIARPEHHVRTGDTKPEQFSSDKAIYVMPLDEQDDAKNHANTQACVAVALKHGYRLTLQTHKLIGVR